MAREMIILTRTFDLLEWLLPKSERFPRSYRATVTQRMLDAALDFQEALFDAQSQGKRGGEAAGSITLVLQFCLKIDKAIC